MIPDLTRAVGVPRLPGISYPMSRPLGNPHDADRRRAVLRAMLEVLPRAAEPDTYVELAFEWPEPPSRERAWPKELEPAPIVKLLKKKPWLLPRLYGGRIPESGVVSAENG